MGMLDLHALSSGGSTGGLGAIGTILLGGDGQTAAGVPIAPGARLVHWGGMTTIADTIEALRLRSPDQLDPIQGEYFFPGASSLLGILGKYDNLIYQKGARTVDIDQNTGAANAMAWLLDHYNGGPVMKGSRHLPNQITVRQVAGGALTAITWGQTAFAPAPPLPIGSYALLGAWVNALTNYALVRFAHPDFSGFKPGFPVTDQSNTALANANVPKDPLYLEQGYQFVYLSEESGLPMVPIFRATSTGSSLVIELAAISADTPIVQLNLARVG